MKHFTADTKLMQQTSKGRGFPMIKEVRVTHSSDVQCDIYGVADYPLEVRMDSGTGRLIVISGLTQTIYAFGAWTRVSVDYASSPDGLSWDGVSKMAAEALAKARVTVKDLENDAIKADEAEKEGN